MNLLQNVLLLSALTLPLAAQRSDANQGPQSEPPVPTAPDVRAALNHPAPAYLFTVELKVDQQKRLATMTSADRTPFFGFMIAATKNSQLDIPGVGGLLEYEAIVATALCKDGVMALDLGKGGWGFDVYLQGVAVSAHGAAMTSIQVVSDKAQDPKGDSKK
jgi:hypothetical protein